MPSFNTANTVPPACCSTCACEYGRCVYTYTMTVAKADGTRSAVSAGTAACVDNASLAAITWGWSKVSEDETYCYYEFKQEGPCCTEEGDPCDAPEFSGPPLPTPAPDCTIGGGGGETTCVKCASLAFDCCFSTDTIANWPDKPTLEPADFNPVWNPVIDLANGMTGSGMTQDVGVSCQWFKTSGVIGPITPLPGAAHPYYRVRLNYTHAGLLRINVEQSPDGTTSWSYIGTIWAADTGITTELDCCKFTVDSGKGFGRAGGNVNYPGPFHVTLTGNTCCRNEAGDCITGTTVCADGSCNPLP